jgi:hypothetical protein
MMPRRSGHDPDARLLDMPRLAARTHEIAPFRVMEVAEHAWQLVD